MTATMTRKDLEARAAQRGYSLHEAVTDEALAVVNPNLMMGHATRIREAAVKASLELTAEELDAIPVEAVVVPYRIGKPGETVVAPPQAVDDLMIVILPQYTVLRHVTGVSRSFDGDRVGRAKAMTYTILV